MIRFNVLALSTEVNRAIALLFIEEWPLKNRLYVRAGPIPQNPTPVPTPIPGSEPESPILLPGMGLKQGGGSGPIPQKPIPVPTPILGKICKRAGSLRLRFQEWAGPTSLPFRHLTIMCQHHSPENNIIPLSALSQDEE